MINCFFFMNIMDIENCCFFLFVFFFTVFFLFFMMKYIIDMVYILN